jgi:hypothetical protein
MTGPYTDAFPVSPGLDVLLPSGATITSTHQATLDLPSLPLAARTCHLFPDLTSGSLISIGQLCNYGCTANFTATTVTLQHDGQTVLQGSRAPPSGLWIIPTPAARALDPVVPPTMLLSSHQNSVADRVAFYHAAMFSPPISTWCAAIDAGFLTTWPDLTSSQVRRHPPPVRSQ